MGHRARYKEGEIVKEPDIPQEFSPWLSGAGFPVIIVPGCLDVRRASL